ncbi:hypothetical protein KR093_002479 [Drosophila rubida]|uniref:DUF753 domain-containing protein n=1 Tax=Drosophila rubida TaxID=30044 RepID=A0AAD4PJM5_9MUSC|nr:hypothetical protein KR093_002479 [Drosophila rubida]
MQPAERLSCHVCHSEEDANCETSPNAAALCVLHRPGQQCVTSIDENGFTVRGCGDSLSCVSGDAQSCQRCVGENCNTINLQRRSDGQPGGWGQELPLSCLSCNDTAACAGSALTATACESNLEYCMTVLDAAGKVQSRGCSNVVEAAFSAYCDNNDGQCHNCNSNSCNSAASVDSYTQCVYCESSVNSDCIADAQSVSRRRGCNGKCMTALKPVAGSEAYDLVRGCLDDKEPADQALCAAGSDKNCVACDGDACNVAEIEVERLSCYVCTDTESCTEPDQAVCLNYSPSDRCYMLFDETVSVIEMGCRSDLDKDFEEENISDLFFCEGNNCNSYDNMPQPNNCKVCSSLDDPNCAVDPNKITDYAHCNVVPHTGCVTRVLNGSTQRGCVSNLASSPLKECLKGEGNCEVCTGEMCNAQVYPADRRRCQRCNSLDDASCESAPSAASVCPRYDESQGCSSKLVDGATYRGCQTEFVCDDADKQYCRNCAGGDNCNVVDLNALAIGYPGKWVTPPVNCYTCEGVACQGSSLGALQKCAGNDAQNCATVFASNGSVVLRACSDQLYANAEHAQYCDANTASCKFCKSTGCNNARSLDNYVSCLLCDGSEQADCVRSVSDVGRQTSCQGSCFTGLYERTRGGDDSPLELARGCLDDLEYDDREACAAGTLPHCVACTGAGCNTAAVPEQRLSCNYCADESCAELTPLTCTAYRTGDQCYIHVGDKRIERMGCASDLERSELQQLRRDLYLCSGDNCNTKDVINTEGVSCQVCNSTEQAACIAGEATKATVCQHYLYPQCYTHLTTDGAVQRGCLMDTEDEVFDDCLSGESEKCRVCDANNCNNELYPADWQRCLRCDSASDADCAKQPASHASYCPSYQADEQCVSSLERGRTRRGCSSELACDADQPANCRYCTASDCNSVDLVASYVGEPGRWQDLPLSCHVCADAASCATLSTPVTCAGNNRQLCSTVFNAAGVVVARNCSDALAAQCAGDDVNCQLCKSNGCNNAQSLSDYVECYHCDAELDESCAWSAPETQTRQCQGQCMTGLYPRSSAPDSALLPTRGCLDDLEESERELCAAGKHGNCTACSGALCNAGNVIAEPQECYVCGSSDCVDMEPGRCVAYRTPHQCYLAFEDNEVVAMGCASDFETPVIGELVAQRRLLVCDGQNCNNPSTEIPQPNTCQQCNSLQDTRCATNPNQLLTTEVCAQLPYTECVTHIDAATGATRRGCLAELAGEDFVECLAGTLARCDVCTGSNCNGLAVFPADRRRCHICNSSSDPNCAAAPSSSAVCPVYDANDGCVTTLRDGVTHRGCSSSLSCADPNDRDSCRVCSDDDNCNTVNLAQLQVHGKPGTWQQTPIECLSCSGATQCSNGGGTLQKCAGSDNCATLFDDSGAVTARGCNAQLEASASSYCEAQPEQCPRCNSNGCNVADSLDSYVDCLVCDSSTSADCVRDVSGLSGTRKCYKGCLTALRPLFNETATEASYALVRNCQDDKEAADSASCASGQDATCAVCNTNKCNTQDLVTERLSCLSCSGDDCQLPQAASCANYRAGDACYIRFDEARSVVAHGCLSELSLAEIYALRLAQRLVSCETGSNCNTLDSLPPTQSCVLCSSRTDRNCAVSPESVTSATDCAQLGLTQCYTRVLQDGATERGCLASLEDEQFLGCYNGTASDCVACVGAGCNGALYPSDRRKCHVCNSESEASCASAPSSLAVCPVYAADEECVTNLRGGITYRGCGSSLSCEPNSKSCVYCQGDGCNVADLTRYDDDNHGKWQDLPLRCLDCTGDACQASGVTSQRCADNNEQDCVTVFDATGAVVRRGCEDAVAQDDALVSYCANSADNCPACKSNDCNNATAKTQYNSCIYCDSYKDISCLWEPTGAQHKRRQCQGDCMTALHGAAESGYDLIRSCLDDKEADDQSACRAGDANCVACSGADCNVATLPATRRSCYHCGEDGVDCVEPVQRLCDVYKPEDSCYLWVDSENDIKQLGCLSSFRNQDVESMLRTKRIAICDDGDNCNTPQLQAPVKCAVCNSRTNASCATTPLAVDHFEVCSQFPHTHCVTQLDSEGATIRGCLFDLPQADFANCLLGKDPNCEICAKDGCNREIFPADRQRCYTCSSEDDSNCESDPRRSEVCPWVSQWETCQTQLQGNVTTRGCSSLVLCDTDDYRNCRSCVGSECNAIDLANRHDDGQHGLFQTLPLKCHTCEGEHCLHSLGPATTCTRNTAQDCKTVFEADGEAVRRRGCADDVDDYEDHYCRMYPELCFSCKSNECNDAWELTDYTSCLYCNSANADECVTYPQSAALATRKCKGGCLVALLEDKQLLRSCLDDKEAYDRVACSDDGSGSNCAACADGDCNTFSYPADRLSCHVCTGEDCASSVATPCLAYDEEDYCFAKYAQGALQLLGCASSQNTSDLEQWQQANELYSCRRNDCNDLARLPQSGECVSCDSSKTPDCAQAPTLVNTTITCHMPQPECVTRLENGHTIRGCLSSLSSSESSACVANGSCASCAGAKCNAGVFPLNRRQCHICNSVADDRCAEYPNSVAVCPIYVAEDTCVAALDAEGYLQRGCGSQLQCELDDEDHCQVCSTDACNIYQLNGAATLAGLGLVLTLLVSLASSSWL